MAKNKSPKGKSKKDKTDSGKKKKDKQKKDETKTPSPVSDKPTKKESKPKTGSTGEGKNEEPTNKHSRSSTKSKKSEGKPDEAKKTGSSNDEKKHHHKGKPKTGSSGEEKSEEPTAKHRKTSTKSRQSEGKPDDEKKHHHKSLKRTSRDDDAPRVDDRKTAGKQKSVAIKASKSKPTKHDVEEAEDDKKPTVYKSREHAALVKKKSAPKQRGNSEEKRRDSKGRDRGSFEAVRAKLVNIKAKTDQDAHEELLQDIESRKQLRLQEGASVRENLENWKKSLKKVEKGKEKTYEKKHVPERYKQMENELKNMRPNEWYVAPFTNTASSLCNSGVGVAPPMGPVDRPRSQCPWLYTREYDIGLLLNTKPCATNPWTKGELPGDEGDEEYLKLLKARVKMPFGAQMLDSPQPQSRKDSFAVPAWQSFPAGPSKPGFAGTSDFSETNEELIKYDSFRGGRSSGTVMKEGERRESLEQKSAPGIARINQPMDLKETDMSSKSGLIGQQTEMAYIMGIDSARSNNARVYYR